MTEQAPTVYHLYGDDHLAMEEFVQDLQERLGPQSNAALSVQTFSASHIDFGELEESCLSIPFLTHRRIVVLDGIEALPKDQALLDRFFTLLETLPATTALILLETREQTGSSRKQTAHPIAQWIAKHPDISFTRECTVPRGNAFVDWIVTRCSDLGGAINLDAARLLANWVIENPFQADQEIRKLIAYVDGAREINVEDVQKLTPFQSQSNMFALVDAFGERKGQQAQRLLTRLLEEEDPKYVFAMVVRQFRLLLIAREAIDTGTPLTSVLHLPPFVIRKIEAQARAFNDRELKQIYSRLLEIDIGSKSSSVDLEAGLDTLLATITTET